MILGTNLLLDVLKIFNYFKQISIFEFASFNNYFLFFVGFSFLLTVINALSILITNNPVNAVLHMVLCFVIGSFFFFCIRLDFFGYIFLIVYVGAIAVLFLFIVMMFDIKINKTTLSFMKFLNDYFWKILIMVTTYFFFIFFIFFNFENLIQLKSTLSKTYPLFNANLGEFLMKCNKCFYNLSVNPLINNLESKINIYNAPLIPLFRFEENNLLHYLNLIKLYNEYSILLILSGVILLVGMIGSIVLAMSTINVNLDLNLNYNTTTAVRIKRQELIQQFNRHSKISKIFFKKK